MRCLRSVIGPWDATGPYGLKLHPAPGIGPHPTKSLASGVECFFLRVLRVIVFSFRISLPDFHHSVWHSCAVAIKNSAHQRDALTFGSRLGDRTNRARTGKAEVKIWTNRLRCGGKVFHRSGLKWSLFTSTKKDIEAKSQAPFRLGCVPVKLRDQPLPRFF